jgi:hypothetical protein
MWDRLSNGQQFIITLTCIIVGVGGLCWGLCYFDNNGVRTRTDEVCYSWELEKVPEGIEIPIEVEAYVEYRGDNIKSIERIVEFCDVKATRKEMRQEMKTIWKEMKEGCK